MERLRRDFVENHGMRALEHHAVAIITTNPFFGCLSYKDENFTGELSAQLFKMAAAVGESVRNSSGHAGGRRNSRFEIICGDTAALQAFHEEFYAMDPRKQELADERTKWTNDRLAELENRAGAEIVTRVKVVPPNQFAVVGDVVYDFTLESFGQRSEIFDTDVKQDRRTARKAFTTFEILKTLG